MYMVDCDQKYWEFVLVLRNELRQYFFNQSIIEYKDHEKFMTKWHKNYYVCLNTDGVPMGWVGVVNDDIRIAVDPVFQKQGVGKFMLKFVKDEYPQAKAKILASNMASINTFKSVGIKIEEV